MHISECTQQGIKMLIFGGYGTGKTRFCMSLPQPIYFYDFDKGVRTVYAALLAEDVDVLKNAKIDFDTYGDNPLKRPSISAARRSRLSEVNRSPEAYLDFEDKLSEQLTACDEAKKAGDPMPLGTAVIDSLTTFSKAFLDYIMAVNVDQGRVFAVPNLNDYGNFVRKMMEVLSMFHLLTDYGVHCVTTAHMQLKEDVRGPKDNQTYRGIYRVPAIVGKDLPFNIGCLYDEVYHSYVTRDGDEAEYWFETKADDDVFCKSRSPEMPTRTPQEWPRIRRRLIADE